MSIFENFWEISDTGKLVVNITRLYGFLNRRGYRKEFRDNEIILYKITNQFIELVDINDLINEVISYLKYEYKETTERVIEYARKDSENFVYSPADVLEAVTKFSFNRIFDKKNWNYIKELEVQIKRHTVDKAYFYFENAFVEITAGGVQLLPYELLSENEKVFKTLVISKKIGLVDIEDKRQQEFAKLGTSFYHFLHMISSKTPETSQDENSLDAENKTNAKKLDYLMKLIGYCLHDYKQHGKTDFACMFCDENVGGTGKGTIVQALSQLIDPNDRGAICEIDGGKALEKYDPVELNVQTRLKVYNDITSQFLSNTIYNEITDSASLRQMHSGSVRIPYHQSWKLMVLANFTLRGGDGHLLRRFQVYYMTPFFHRERTIRDYYQHSLFSTDWQENDWIYFYNVMFECVRLWLCSNYKIDYEDPEYLEYKIESSYYAEFREYIDALKPDFYSTSTLFEAFKSNPKWNTEPHVRKMSPTFFGRLLTNYLKETHREHYKTSNRTQIWIGAIKNTPGKDSNLPF